MAEENKTLLFAHGFVAAKIEPFCFARCMNTFLKMSLVKDVPGKRCFCDDDYDDPSIVNRNKRENVHCNNVLYALHR